MDIRLLYSDDNIAVCIKPAGVLSEEGGMPEFLSSLLGGDFLCVHRLDKPVGGVMAYARSRAAAAELSRAVTEGRFEKEYLAAAQGVPQETSGSMRDLLFHDSRRNKSFVVDRQRRGVKEALLDYELISTAQYAGMTVSALRIRLHTGRTHQIRVQLASRGMPLAGDGRYGSALRDCGLALWAASLRFPHPVTGRTLCFSASPPDEAPWRELGLHNKYKSSLEI